MTLDPQADDVPDRLRGETDGRGVDVAITACPLPEVQSEAIRVLAPFGRLCLFGGLPKTTGPTALDTNAIHYGNLLVTGSTGGSVEGYRIAMKLVAGKRIDLRQVISNVFRFDELREAYETALAGAEGKVVLMAE